MVINQCQKIMSFNNIFIFVTTPYVHMNKNKRSKRQLEREELTENEFLAYFEKEHKHHNILKGYNNANLKKKDQYI